MFQKLCYTTTVQTSFYASGFLYNLRKHQILLLQSPQIDDEVSSWSMLGGESLEGEEAQATFQRIVQQKLNINLKPKQIYPVYDYFHDTLDKVNFVFYAEVGRTLNFDPSEDSVLSWVTFDQTLKFLFSGQTKRDVMISERVIHLKERTDEASRVSDHTA